MQKYSYFTTCANFFFDIAKKVVFLHFEIINAKSIKIV